MSHSSGTAPPDRPDIQRAAEHLAAGRPADAAEALTALVASAPTYAAAHVLRAVALEAAGQPDAALAAWQQAAFLVPRSPLVARERTRLTALAVDEAPRDDVPADDAGAAPPADAPPADAQPADAQPAGAQPAGAADEADPYEAPPPETDDPPALEMLPLDDLATSFDTAPADADDALDPGDFDFSAFDLDDDDAGWLLGQDTAAEAPPAPPADAWDDDALPPDWSETLRDESVHLMPPEAPDAPAEASAEAPDDASPLAGEWAVFEDEPAEPADAETDLFETASFEDVFANADEAPPGEAPPGEAPPGEAPPGEAPPDAPSVADELDSLIASLEQAPRIRPDPTFAGPAVGTTAGDVDGLASETLARIYAAQHQYVEAAVVYETLAARDPARAEEMLRQAAAMRGKKA